jgi:RND family efflux transporter MFP subunit
MVAWRAWPMCWAPSYTGAGVGAPAAAAVGAGRASADPASASEAATALQLPRDRERAERLVAAGAAPQKRLDEARAAEEQARARATGAEARIAQYQTARTAGASPSDDGLFVLRAPVTGTIAERTGTTGANVSAGTVLFRIVDVRQVQVAGQVPEADFARARLAKAAELEVPGQRSRVPVGRLSSVGRVLDPRTRTVPISFALDNSSLGLVVGQAVFLHLLLDESSAHPVVPASAIVDDAGRPIVFVQREGEAFERRPVTLGARSGSVVQVTNGVKAGDRVVTTGAYLVRLASPRRRCPRTAMCTDGERHDRRTDSLVTAAPRDRRRDGRCVPRVGQLTATRIPLTCYGFDRAVGDDPGGSAGMDPLRSKRSSRFRSSRRSTARPVSVACDRPRRSAWPSSGSSSTGAGHRPRPADGH